MNLPNIFGFREDCGGRRRIKDRRSLVSPTLERERRTNWKRRSGFDRRSRSLTAQTILERREVPENQPDA